MLAVLVAAPGCRTWFGLRPVPAQAVGAQPRYVPSEKNMVSLPPYVIEPPDILLIDALRVIPKAPFKVQPLDVLQLQVEGTGAYQPINGLFLIEPSGMLNLGPAYGKVKVGDLSLEEATEAVTKHLKRILKEPQVSLTLNESGGQQQVAGEHLVGPDGTVNLGTYGLVYVAGMTIEEARNAIEEHLKQYLEAPLVSVDVFAYNSKVYYVITEGAGLGDNIQRFPVTGNETVLDAVSLINGLKPAVEQEHLDCPAFPLRLRSDSAGAVGRDCQRRRHLHQLPGAAGGPDLHLAGSPDRPGYAGQQDPQPDRTCLRHQLIGHADHPNRSKLPRWHEQCRTVMNCQPKSTGIELSLCRTASA